MARFSTYLGSHWAQIKVQFSSGIIGPLPSLWLLGELVSLSLLDWNPHFHFPCWSLSADFTLLRHMHILNHDQCCQIDFHKFYCFYNNFNSHLQCRGIPISIYPHQDLILIKDFILLILCVNMISCYGLGIILW